MPVIMRISHASEPAFHARSIHGAPMVINDEMPPTRNMVDGKLYTSKSAMRATFKPSGNAQGDSYAEVGGDPAIYRTKPKAKPDRKAIRAAVDRAFSKAGLGA